MAEIHYKPIQTNEWPDDLPNKGHFEGGDIDVHTFRWAYRRDPGSGGGNEAQDFNVPEGRVIVGWDANETSCINCKGRGFHIVMSNTGTRTFPIGIRTGARLEPGGHGGPGASFTGDLSLISVKRSLWKPVADSMEE